MKDKTRAIVANKKQISDFVRDAAEIEEREFLLRESAEELETITHQEVTIRTDIHFAKGKENSLLYKLNQLTEKKQTIATYLNNIASSEDLALSPAKLNEYNELPEKDNYHKEQKILKKLGIAFLVNWILPSILSTFLMPSTICLIILVFVDLVFVAELIITHIRIKKHNAKVNRHRELKPSVEKYYKTLNILKNCQNNLAKAEKDRADCEKLYLEAQNATEKLVEKLSIIQKRNTFIRAQANVLTEKANELSKQKAKLYALDIVPPDYRTLDCVVILHSIFSNDLADTMREAILLYEEKVFRGELLRGIDQIYNMLGNLAYSMHAIESRLTEVKKGIDNIHRETISLSNQLYGIDDTMKQYSKQQQEAHLEKLKQGEAIRKNQEKLIQETEATRYATESVAQSQKTVEWYIDQRRMGLL